MRTMKKNNFLLSGYYLFYFAAQGCAASFLNVYLEEGLGFDGSQLGWYHAATALAPAFILPFLGHLADESGKAKWLLSGGLLLLIGASWGLGVQDALLGAILWGAAWECARSLCVSMADRSAMLLRGSGYGSTRSAGSLGFLLGGGAMGLLAEWWGLEKVLFPVYAGLIGLALLCAVGIPTVKTKQAQQKPEGSMLSLWNVPLMWFALLMGALSTVGVSVLQPFLGTHLVMTMGASEGILGWNTLLCVGPELVLLPLFSQKWLPKWGFRMSFLVTTLALALRCVLYALAPSPMFFLGASLLYGLSMCASTVLVLTFLQAIVPQNQYGAAVLLSTAVSTVGRALFGWLFGVLYRHLGSGSIFWCLAALSLAVAGLVWKLKIPVPVPQGSDRCP